MKTRSTVIALMAVVIGIGIGYTTQAAEKTAESKKQTTCPVMGGAINKAQYADVQGKRIYVCCPGCIGKIKADPGKYITQLESKGVKLDKAAAKKDTTASKSGCGSCGSH